MTSETSKCRAQLLQYCQGNGLDLGSAGDPISPTAVQVELDNPYCPLLGHKYPPQLSGDATRLYWFADAVMDYVYSSHLLEDFLDWTPVLIEWIRVLKSGGHLVILMPEIGRWQAALQRGQPPNLAHKHEAKVGELSAAVTKICPFEIIHDGLATPEDPTDYGLIFVGRKL